MKDLEIEKIRGVEGDFVRLLNVAKIALILDPKQIADELDTSDEEAQRLLKVVRELLK